MNITEPLVDQISGLSRLELSQEERAATTKELERILTYMELLNQVDTTGVEPLSHVFPLRNVTRPDETEPSYDRAALLAASPASDEETFLTPKTIE